MFVKARTLQPLQLSTQTFPQNRWVLFVEKLFPRDKRQFLCDGSNRSGDFIRANQIIDELSLRFFHALRLIVQISRRVIVGASRFPLEG